MARLLPRTTRTLSFPITCSLGADAAAIPLARSGGEWVGGAEEWGRDKPMRGGGGSDAGEGEGRVWLVLSPTGGCGQRQAAGAGFYIGGRGLPEGARPALPSGQCCIASNNCVCFLLTEKAEF
jgi:hypothetical protein